MNRDEISSLVEQAIGRLVERDPELLCLDVAERSLSHQRD